MPNSRDREMSREETFRVESHPRYHRRHHTEKGFRNIWEEAPPGFSFFTALRWVISHALQRKENLSPPLRPLDTARLRESADPLQIVWFGHSSLLIRIGDLTILVDPVFSNCASPVSFIGPKRLTPLPEGIDDLPQIDILLLSHNHYDHCDKRTLRDLFRRCDPVVLVPLGMKPLMKRWGAGRVAELDWWQYVDVGGIRFHAAPARHFSGRGLRDRNRTLWASWYLEELKEEKKEGAEEGLRIYFGGDTAYAEHFAEIREQFGPPHVAMMPVGAYLPRWFMEPVHVDPAQAVQAFRDLGGKHLIPIHWGVFDLADEPLAEPIELTRKGCAETGIADALCELPVGGIFTL